MRRFLFGCLLAALPLAAQGGPRVFLLNYTGQSDGQGHVWGTADVRVQASPIPVLLGAPYSGEETQQSLQILADDTRVTRPAVPGAKIWRDSLGRTRTERPLTSGPSRPGAPPPLIFAEILDPVDGYAYLLDDTRKTAYRAKYTPLPPRSAPSNNQTIATPGGVIRVGGGFIGPGPAPANGPVVPQMVTESLGSKTIQGAPAEGLRTTTTFPPGSQGNDRPIVVVQERWTSSQLQLTLLSRSTDPRNGESTSEIANLSLLNPDPLLFRPPPGYVVKDVDQTFKMEFGEQPAGARATGSFSGAVAGPALAPPPVQQVR